MQDDNPFFDKRPIDMNRTIENIIPGNLRSPKRIENSSDILGQILPITLPKNFFDHLLKIDSGKSVMTGEDWKTNTGEMLSIDERWSRNQDLKNLV